MVHIHCSKERRQFLQNNTHEWTHILDDITHNYNNSRNRSIKMKPNDVNEHNANQVWLTLYGDSSASGISFFPLKPKFFVGDIVRVEKYHPETRHKKGYTINFTDEEFKIIGVYRSNPTMYKIQDLGTDEKINGRFYERELSLVKKRSSEMTVGPKPVLPEQRAEG